MLDTILDDAKEDIQKFTSSTSVKTVGAFGISFLATGCFRGSLDNAYDPVMSYFLDWDTVKYAAIPTALYAAYKISEPARNKAAQSILDTFYKLTGW